MRRTRVITRMLHPSLYIFSDFPLLHSFLNSINHILPKLISIMTVKKVEIKVDINCEKCKNAIMQAVTELEGVNQVALDQEKSLLTVVGTMDPVCVVAQLKKIKQKPVVVSVGPPKPPEPKPDPKLEWCKPCLPYCNTRDIVTVSTYESGSSCTIV